ncbi:NTF2-like protein [Dacryopinax primogenitus]|uniref:NTF2-like protein n=1 Tax=Dacryopinax primogenitus (strain DJM 731) TaxID=1858805 RepID=M5GE21_DACPD|nr:NTF2-like protein [Dacryopinax primogenitus]EJU05012.1 NTF2-like protein [Dacryopinax primogenitus]
MADAKWAYREPQPVTGHEKEIKSKRRTQLKNAISGAGSGDAGASTGVGSARRGGSSALRGGDQNMDDGPGSRRYDILNRRGRPADASIRMPVENTQHVQAIQDFVRRKYNPAAQFLAFDDILGDQVLRASGMTKWSSVNGQDKLADALWKAAGELDPPVQTISAARNNMGKAQVHRIAQFLPELRNLSLKDNELNSLGDISSFFTRNRVGGLRHLKEIWLAGNHLREVYEQHKDLDQYYYTVANAIRSLKVVDGQPIPGATWDIQENTQIGRRAWPDGQAYPISYPLPMASSSVDEHLRDMIGGILSQFFAFYDNDRERLINAYHPSATFSFTALPSLPPRQIAIRYQPEKGTAASPPLLRNMQTTIRSRDLRFATGAQQRAAGLHVGHVSILQLFNDLPPSQHPLQDGSKFVFDATLLPDMGTGDMLEVSVHGEFTEPHTDVVFSFTRAFVFVTAPPGSSAEKIGMNVLVMSDMLMIRRTTSSSIWTPGPMITQEEEWMRKPWSRGLPAPPRGNTAPPAATITTIPSQPAANPFQAVPSSNAFGMPAPPATFQQQPAFQQPQLMSTGFAVSQPQQPPQQIPLPPGQQPPTAGPTLNGPAEVPPEMASLTPGQRELATTFSNVTGLVIPATLSVLSENAWDGDAAYAKLLEVKTAIPAEWWIGGQSKI